MSAVRCLEMNLSVLSEKPSKTIEENEFSSYYILYNIYYLLRLHVVFPVF